MCASRGTMEPMRARQPAVVCILSAVAMFWDLLVGSGRRGWDADIFDKNRNSMKGPNGMPPSTFGIESGGYSDGVWVHLDD